jgi:hypothetical protein
LTAVCQVALLKNETGRRPNNTQDFMEDIQMHDDCLLELYQYLMPDARGVFDALAPLGSSTMEGLMLAGQLTTQQVRKGVWGLASTGLIVYNPGRPVQLSKNGTRLATLLAEKQAG